MNLRTSAASARLHGSTRIFAAMAVAAGVTFGTAACGSIALSGTAAPAAASADGAAAVTTAEASDGAAVTADGAPSGSSDHTIDICRLLPVATVASVTGKALTEAAEDDTPQNQLYQCSYTNAAGTDSVTVDALAAGAGPGYAATLEAEGGGAKPINGLGDKAFSGITGVHALFGTVLIDVANLDSDAAAESLIRTLQPKL